MDEGDNTHLSFALGALPPPLKLRWTSKRIGFACPPKPCAKEDAGGQTTPTELSPVIALLLVVFGRGELSAFTPSPTGVASVVSRDALVGLRYMARERRQKLKSVKLPPPHKATGDRHEAYRL